MKRVISILIATVILFGTAACGPNPTSANDQSAVLVAGALPPQAVSSAGQLKPVAYPGPYGGLLISNAKEISVADIKGIKVGHAQNLKAGTGCTAIICEAGAAGGVDVRGGSPATRQTDMMNPINGKKTIHCVMLSGGSAYGLDAGSGAVKYLEEHGHGLNVRVGVVPIVPGACIFDLAVGDNVRPDMAMGYEACKNAVDGGPIAQGNVGAGTGASVGKFKGMNRAMKSGLGSYAVQTGNVQIGAVVSVNAVGDIIDIETGRVLAGLLDETGKQIIGTRYAMYEELSKTTEPSNENTTIACVVTNVKLDSARCNKLASIAHNGYALSISPVHTMSDGDTIFVISTGEVEANFMTVGQLATEVVAMAVNKAATEAKGAYGLKSAGDFR